MDIIDLETNTDRFTSNDYAIFLTIILFSAGVGIYLAWKSHSKRRNLNNHDFKKFPVAMSQLASFTSAVSLLGLSHETYRFGSMYLLTILCCCITQPIASHVFLPFFHKLKLTSTYEYLEYRFNRLIRITATIIFMLQMLLYMSVVLYTPSLAIQQVTGLSLWISILLTGILCIIYTILGGIKAVAWVDVFQLLVILTGLVLIITEGTRRVSGIKEVWKKSYITGRIEFFDFDPNPFKRHSFWTIIIGGIFTSMTIYGSSQTNIQRYLILPTLKKAIISMYLNLIGTLAILILAGICGLVAFSFYFDCDPKSTNRISRYDQILLLFAIDLFKDIPGMSGVFIACIYAASLSTISSGLNALATVCLHDFIEPLNANYKSSFELNPKSSAIITKVIAAIFGLIIIALSFICQYLGSTVLQSKLIIFGVIGGPLLGVIALGMLIPFANKYGAFVGLIVALVLNLTLSIISIIFGLPPTSKSFRTIDCSNTVPSNSMSNTQDLFESINTTTIISSLNNNYNSQSNGLFKFQAIFQLSYLWYSVLAVFNVFFVGIIVSLITGRNNTDVLDPLLYIDLKSLIKRRYESIKREDDVNEKSYSQTGSTQQTELK